MKAVKVLIVTSAGGHWVQMMQLRRAFDALDVAYACTAADYAAEVAGARFYVLQDANRWSRWKLVRLCGQVLRVLCIERPTVVVTTGAAPGLIALVLARCLLGARTVWIDSIANCDHLSLSGRLARPFATVWLTQWPELQRPEGPAYWGRVL